MARLPEPRLGRLPGSSHWPRWSRIPAGDVLAGRGRGIYSTPSRPGRRCGSGPGCGSWAHTPPGGQRGGDLSPRVEIAQSADLSPVMIYLGERARDEVRGRARGPGGPGTHTPPLGGSAAYVYPAVVTSSWSSPARSITSRSLCQPSRNAVT